MPGVDEYKGGPAQTWEKTKNNLIRGILGSAFYKGNFLLAAAGDRTFTNTNTDYGTLEHGSLPVE